MTTIPEDEGSVQVETESETLQESEPIQEIHQKDIEKFDRLCCLGDELACQRLGSKHHRTNTRCWTYPKICYHCDLVASVDSKTRLLYMTSIQIQLGTLNAPSIPVKVRSLSKKVRSVNGQSFQNNRRTRAILVHKSAEKSELDTTGIAETVFDIESKGGVKMRTCDIINNPDFHLGPSPDNPVRSIEDYAPAKISPSEFAMGDGSYGRDVLNCEQFRRSQAPSPELQTGTNFCISDERLPLGKETGLLKRDPRYELEFLTTN